MKQAVRLLVLLGLVFGVMALVPHGASTAPRHVMIQDLTAPKIGPITDDMYFRAQRPGKVVRVVPWFEPDGSYRVLVITEVGWVYQSGDDPSEWTLVGRILDAKRR